MEIILTIILYASCIIPLTLALGLAIRMLIDVFKKT